jgi:hypothetical protein
MWRTNMKRELHTTFWSENLVGREATLVTQEVNEIKCILIKKVMAMLTGQKWFRVRLNVVCNNKDFLDQLNDYTLSSKTELWQY